jgi:hypothetical protein
MFSATQPTTQAKCTEQDFYNNVTNKDDIKTILDSYEIDIQKEREDVEHFCEIMSEIEEDYSHVPNIVTVIKRISFYVVNNAISNSK